MMESDQSLSTTWQSLQPPSTLKVMYGKVISTIISTRLHLMKVAILHSIEYAVYVLELEQHYDACT
jgi:hypothetical protein